VVFPNYFSIEVNERYLVEECIKEIERIRAYHEQQLLMKASRPSRFRAVLAAVRSACSRFGALTRAQKQTSAAGAGQ
jgi:hypothetical protein